jgi:TnpA family transposase
VHLFAVKILHLPPRVAAMLEGVLRHCTDMTIKHQMTDSHGQSKIGFAFSHLLGFRLLPRLKPIHSQRLALVEAGTQDDYPHLKEVLGKAINWDVIRQQYERDDGQIRNCLKDRNGRCRCTSPAVYAQ